MAGGFFSVLLLGLALAPGACAEVALLLPGYLESASAWRSSGVAGAVEAGGWHDGGRLGIDRAGQVRREERPRSPAYYAVSLPTEAPLQAQAEHLARYVEAVRLWHPGESLYLVGHSAGGVVARLFMVRHPEVRVSALVTIAAPHLGTDTAEIGALVGQTPLAMLAPLIGGETLLRSQPLYRDLVRERPDTLLFWLNRQPHPQAEYIAIVRRDSSGLGLGDLVVPEWSQDMNNVYALRGRARTVQVEGGHDLQADDGAVLLRVLASLRRS
jgi:pimeloyl-ACP methyl ester carboxylesterase